MDPIAPSDEIRRVETNTLPEANGLRDLGREEFLKLMIAQLENQDPWEPMADQEFIAQMAQFSSLEEMQEMNKNLASSLDWSLHLSQTINNTMATSLIGRTVSASSEAVHLGADGNASIPFELAGPAADVRIELFDADGQLVSVIRRQDIEAGEQVWEWDGKNLQGNRVGSGLYEFKIYAEDANGERVDAVGHFEGEVSGVRYVEGAAYLNVNGVLVPLDSIQEIAQKEDGGA